MCSLRTLGSGRERGKDGTEGREDGAGPSAPQRASHLEKTDGTSLVVKNLPFNAGDAGLIPGQGTEIPHTTGQLSPHASTREKPTCHNDRSCTPQLRPDTAKNKYIN